MDGNPYWLQSSVVGNMLGGNDNGGGGPGQADGGKLSAKDADLSVISQPTMVDFANIFAGATAAAASNGSQNVLQQAVGGGKNFNLGTAFPSLNQLTIPPASQLSKRNQSVFPINPAMSSNMTPAMSTINDNLVNTSSVISNAADANINSPLQRGGSSGGGGGGNIVHTSFASTQQHINPTTKDFIQQAAAESGVPTANPSSSHLQQTFSARQVETTASAAVSTPVGSDPANPLKCTECDKTFEQAGQLSYHAFVAHAQLQARPHKCPSCPESFLAAHHLQDHLKAVHLPMEQQGSGATPFTCSECSASFTNGGQLNYHIYMAHTMQGPKIMQHMCTQCGKNFMKATLLASHMRNVHGVRAYNGAGGTGNPPDDERMLATITPDGTKQYHCRECDKSFKTSAYLKQHMLAVHNKPHKCDECGKGFGRKSDLHRHMRGVHMRERPHVCTKCGWTFAEAGNLKHHVQAVHSKEKNYRCMICSKSFSISSYLKTHMVRVHGLVDNPKTQTVAKALMSNVVQTSAAAAILSTQQNAVNNLQLAVASSQHVSRCFECGQIFPNAAMLQNHVMSTHPQPFWCTVCGEGFTQAYQLQIHLQTRHSSGGLPSTQTNNNTNSHQQQQQLALEAAVNQRNNATPLPERAHNTPTPAVARSQQPAVSSEPANQAGGAGGMRNASEHNMVSSLQQQRSTSAAGERQQQEKCGGCGMFVNKELVPHHVCAGIKFQQAALTAAAAMAMAGERPHLCTKCGKGFKTATHLKQHVRCVHTKDRPHKCQLCCKTFARTSDLNRHVKGVHERQKPAIKGLRLVSLKCSECSSSFSEASQLKRHILTVHLDQRPVFKCADCQEGFADENGFKSHICHEQDRPHVCSICSKRFIEAQQLRRHVRSAHTHHGPPQQHECFECHRTFTRPVDLDRHIHAVHLKEKPHKCSICGKMFGLHGNLNKHVRAVHMLEKPHQCVECGKCFAHIGVLKRHLRDIHFYDKRPSIGKLGLKNEDSAAAANQMTVSQMLEAIQQDPHLMQQQHLAHNLEAAARNAANNNN